MIYIDENTTEVKIPKVDYSGLEQLVFTNLVTGHTIIMDSSIEDLSENNVYYTINIAEYISEFMNGQYDYSVINGNKKVASGIAQYGVYTPEIKTYDIPDTEIKTYER